MPRDTDIAWTYPKLKCWISSSLTLFNYEIALTQRVQTFMLVKFRFAPFTTMEMELSWRAGTVMPDEFKFAPFLTVELNLLEEWEFSC